MRDPGTSLSLHVEQEELSLAELYDVELIDETVHRFTSHCEDIEWNGNDYLAIPIQRTPIGEQLNLQADAVSVELENITQEFAEEIQNNLLDGAKITIKRIVFSEEYAAGREMVLFVGTIDVEYNRKVLTLNCSSIINSLNQQVPRNIYQEPCNNRLFGTVCALVKADHKETGTTDADGGDAFTIKDGSGDSPFLDLSGDLTEFHLGEIKITSGSNSGVRKMIRQATDGEVVVTTPFRTEILSGTTYDIYPGCNKTPQACRDRFNNAENFNGYIYIPKPEDSM